MSPKVGECEAASLGHGHSPLVFDTHLYHTYRAACEITTINRSNVLQYMEFCTPRHTKMDLKKKIR